MRSTARVPSTKASSRPHRSSRSPPPGLARDTGPGGGDLLDRWGRDDAFVLDTLAVLLIVFSRLAV